MDRSRSVSAILAALAIGAIAALTVATLTGSGGAVAFTYAPTIDAQPDPASVAATHTRATHGRTAPTLSAAPQMSTAERRPGESEVDYQGRTLSLRMYDEFTSRARLTAAQEAHALDVLADAQRNVLEYRRALRDFDRTDRHIELQHMRQRRRDLRDETATRLAEQLTEQQVEIFRRWILVESFVMFEPLDLP